jgi:heterodisulfide reductase subunit B
MRVALFLGCTVPVRAQNYEQSARRVAERVGIELVDVEGLGCCGYPIKGVSSRATLWMAARSLALAEQQDLDVVSLCSACGATLAEARHELEDERERARANEVLAELGLEYRGTARVRHLGRLLFEELGPEAIARHFTRSLSPLRLALHYGCHYLKPSRAHRGPDEPEAPHSLERLVAATGAAVVHHPRELSCCGGGVLAVREPAALAMAKAKLDAVTAAGAHALVSVCPFCSVMYEGNQKKIEKDLGASYDLPVLYLTQVLGLAMGMDEAELGFKQNRIKPRAVLDLLAPSGR